VEVNEVPEASFVYECENLNCKFDASGSNDSDGSITDYFWNFHGPSGTGKTLSHSFEEPGTYNVKLTVTDNEGDTGSTSQKVSVTLPKVKGLSPSSGPVGTEVTITGSGFSDTDTENEVIFTSGSSEVAAVVKSVMESEIIVDVPGDATTGPIYVEVNGYRVQGPEFTVEQPKSLEVITETAGSDIDQDGYTLLVSGQDDRFVKANDNVIYQGLFIDQVQVELSGIADNCSVSGSNPRTVTLNNSDNAGFTKFEISCEATGPIIDSISPESGPRGTQVTISGANFSSTASENDVRFNGQRAELNNATPTELVAIVPGDATTGAVEVTVDGQTAEGPTFTVITTGTLEVNVSTEGVSQDQDGYGLIIDDGDATPVDKNDVATFSDLQQGSHNVELTDIAANCYIIQDRYNPYQVQISAGNTTSTSIDVSCQSTAPSISGISPESGPRGTEVTISGSNFSSTASENDVRFNGQRAELNNATPTELVAVVPSDATTGTVEVTVDDQTAQGPTFTVVTVAQPKSLQIITETENPPQGFDGYTLSVSGKDTRFINPNDERTINNIFDDSLLYNCLVNGKINLKYKEAFVPHVIAVKSILLSFNNSRTKRLS
jgi:hypothetical protein